MTLGQKIRDLRQQRGLSLRELGSRADVDFTYLSKIENERTDAPSPEVLRRLASVLEVDEVLLIGLTDAIPAELAVLARSPEAMQFVRRASDFARSSEDWVDMLEHLEAKMTERGVRGIGDARLDREDEPARREHDRGGERERERERDGRYQ